jgi:hypothetical protein
MGVSVRKTAADSDSRTPALLKGIRAGRVSTEPAGTYDAEKIRKQLASNTNQAKCRRTAAEKKGGNPSGNPKLVTTDPVTTKAEPDEDGNNHAAEARAALDKIARHRAQLVATRVSLEERLATARREIGDRYFGDERGYLKEVTGLTAELDALGTKWSVPSMGLESRTR